MRKRCYRALAVKNVNVDEVLSRMCCGPVSVGMDIAKEEALVVLRDSGGEFERPWKVKQPSEIGEVVERLKNVREEREVVVAMESTGTYGDALRQALTDAGLKVHRVSSKAVQDYSEIFDGVPSNHDGKDAAMIAELAAIGKSRPWPWAPLSDWEAELERHVYWLDTQQDILQLWLGRLEALLARHWPELGRLLKLNSATVLMILNQFGGPKSLKECPDAAQQLQRWGKSGLSAEKIAAVLDSAGSTVGVRMTAETMRVMQSYAGEALKARKEIRQAKHRLKSLAFREETVMWMAEVVGPVTACVLWGSVGNPHDYHCGEAYRKAIGLNLKERSSGKHEGKLKITKRGPSIARRWLYFAALRRIQQGPVKAWYEKKKCKDKDRGLGAVVAVMRKLALAIHAVSTHGELFVLERLLPGCPHPRRQSHGGSPKQSLGASPQTPGIYRDGAKTKGIGRSRIDPNHPPLVSAPGTALGSVPTVALSSAQAKQK